MCKGKSTVFIPTLRVMDVLVNKKPVSIDFNDYEINKKTFKVGLANGQKILFSKIKPMKPEDQTYLSYVRKEYELIAGQQILAQKKAEKKLSKRRA